MVLAEMVRASEARGHVSEAKERAWAETVRAMEPLPLHEWAQWS